MKSDIFEIPFNSSAGDGTRAPEDPSSSRGTMHFSQKGSGKEVEHCRLDFADVRTDSEKIFQSLLKEGVIIRPGHLWNCPTLTRMMIGTMKGNERFIKGLEKILC